MGTRQLSKKLFAPLFPWYLIVLQLSVSRVESLNVGVQIAGSAITVSKECSRKCESEFCTVPPFLRYGKYCGLLYGGCPGEKPCDGLDSCCELHDACVGARNNDYLSQQCNQDLLDCMDRFRNSGDPTFTGNKCNVEEVMDVISVVIEAAVLAGKIIHRP